MSQLKYEIVRRIETIGEHGNETLELNIVKWGSNGPKYDLRRWRDDMPLKGVTLTLGEANDLLYALGEELGWPEDAEEDEEDNYLDDVSDDSNEEYREEDIDYRSIFVHGRGHCTRTGHDSTEEVVAVLKVLKPNMTIEDVQIKATFCQECNAYYISTLDFIMATKKGRLLCQLMSEDEYRTYRDSLNYGELKPQSILNMVGYNVGAKDGYSDSYRQALLSFAIDAGIVTKKDAIGYLSFFIKLNEGNPNCDSAVKKWRADRDYLKGYDTSGKRYIGGKRIIIGNP